MKSYKSILISGLVVLTALSLGSVARAHEGEHADGDDSHQRSSRSEEVNKQKAERQKVTEKESERQKPVKNEQKSSEVRTNESRREKLNDKRREVCEKREDSVNKVMTNVRDRSDRHFERMSKIFEMTKNFYKEKNLSANNYDQLVAAVDTTKAKAEAANNDMKSLPKFDCSSDGPKADAQAFKTKRQAKIDAFKEYRQALKTLVTSVRDAAKAKGETRNAN